MVTFLRFFYRYGAADTELIRTKTGVYNRRAADTDPLDLPMLLLDCGTDYYLKPFQTYSTQHVFIPVIIPEFRPQKTNSKLESY